MKYSNEQPVNRFMKGGNPIPGLQFQKNPMNMMNQIINQRGQEQGPMQMKENQEMQNQINNTDERNINKNEERRNDNKSKINLKKAGKGSNMDLC